VHQTVTQQNQCKKMTRANFSHEMMHFCRTSGKPKFSQRQVSNANATANEQWGQLEVQQ